VHCPAHADVAHYALSGRNAFRQGRGYGTYLVVGVNSDESIKECKGTAPVMNEQERLAAVQGCKFVVRARKIFLPACCPPAYCCWLRGCWAAPHGRNRHPPMLSLSLSLSLSLFRLPQNQSSGVKRRLAYVAG
jgi:hypothetical protein